MQSYTTGVPFCVTGLKNADDVPIIVHHIKDHNVIGLPPPKEALLQY